MKLGLFFMPIHRPEKPWAQALEEDRQAILLADELGFSEAWMGEHFSTKVEQVPAPLIFLATLIHQTKNLHFGTGVMNLGHRHPIVVAAEAAQFDVMSGGRLMLGVGPGGLNSDAELFGRPEMEERVVAAKESVEMIIRCWTEDAPIRLEGDYWQGRLENHVWPDYGVGALTKPHQQPHPPIAMAMSSPGGPTPTYLAERGFIPMSANFVPQSSLKAQWEAYEGTRVEHGLEVDRSIWRVCRNILITDSEAEAEEELQDPDGTLAYYFRYLGGVRDIPAINSRPEESIADLNERYSVAKAIEKCVIAGTAESVTEQLVDMVNFLGPFGTLISVGHDWDGTDRWQRSMKSLAADVAPVVADHMARSSVA